MRSHPSNYYVKRILGLTLLSVFGYSLLNSFNYFYVAMGSNYSWSSRIPNAATTSSNGCNWNISRDRSNVAMFVIFDLARFSCLAKNNNSNNKNKNNIVMNSNQANSNNNSNNSSGVEVQENGAVRGKLTMTTRREKEGAEGGAGRGSETSDESRCISPDDYLDLDLVWLPLEAFISECERKTLSQSSSSSKLCLCPIYLVFYSEDQKSKPSRLIRRLIQLRILRLQAPPSSAPAAPSSDELNSPRVSLGVVELIIRWLPDRTGDVREINKIIEEAYLNDEHYFVVVHAMMSGSTEEGKLTGGTSERLLRGMTGALSRQPSPFQDVGISLSSLSSSSSASSSPSSSPPTTVSMLTISRIHLEIFGTAFPHDTAPFTEALIAVTSVGLYPANLTHWFGSQGGELNRVEGGGGGGGGAGLLGSPPATIDFKSLDGVMQKLRQVLQRYLQALQNKPCLRSDLSKSKNVISMSLYGSNPRYTIGALRNAQIFPVTYPGWRLIFYCEKPSADGKTKHGEVPSAIIAKIKDLGAEIRYVDPTASGLAPTFWRFLVTEDLNVDLFIIRDCDSRLTSRDAAVVNDWLKTDKAFHCIRDHPSHTHYSISAGLWGGRRAQFISIFGGSLSNTMKQYGLGYIEDQNFLGHDVWPKVKASHAYCHDSVSCDKYESSHPFPVIRDGSEHLGQVYDEYSNGRAGDIHILMSSAINAKCVPSV